MFDFDTLCDFSRANCLSICALLVPANLVATALTMIFTAIGCPTVQIWQAVGIASILALVMFISCLYLVHDWGGDGSYLCTFVARNHLSPHQPWSARLPKTNACLIFTVRQPLTAERTFQIGRA